MVKISFIIVSWNAKAYLVDCIQSILKTACVCEREIIVVDNGSTDGSPAAVARLFPEVRVVQLGSNFGFATGNNVGLRLAAGEYLCLLNSDVRVHEGCVSQLLEFMNSHPDVGMAAPLIRNKDGSVQTSWRKFPTLREVLFEAFGFTGGQVGWNGSRGRSTAFVGENFGEIAIDIASGCFWFVRRKVFIDVGPLDDRFFMYGEDMDWCRRFWDHGWSVMLVPAAEATHYGGGSSENAPVRFYIEMQRAWLQYWGKHVGIHYQCCHAVIVALHQIVRIAVWTPLILLKWRDRGILTIKVRRSWACLIALFTLRLFRQTTRGESLLGRLAL